MSSCGASQASTLPACMSEMRSQRMPSFMKCVVTKIVTPCLRERSIKQLPEAVARDRIDAGRRLVQDQDLRLVQHGDGQREPLPQAHRQIARQRVEVRHRGRSVRTSSRCAPSPCRAAR